MYSNVLKKESRKPKPEPTIHRTSIYKSGEVSEAEIPLSTFRKHAINLSGQSGKLVVVTEDAALRITKQAVTIALERMAERELKRPIRPKSSNEEKDSHSKLQDLDNNKKDTKKSKPTTPPKSAKARTSTSDSKSKLK